MKVICVGLPKTGTKTMNLVLREFGYNVWDSPEQCYYIADDLVRAFDEGCSSAELRELFDGVDAVVDMPACFLWEQLHRAFPEAKVILMIRDEESWYRSWIHQLQNSENNGMYGWFIRAMLYISPTGRKARRLTDTAMRVAFAQKPMTFWKLTQTFNEGVFRRRMHQHNTEVISKVNNKQLLVCNMSDGWDSICNFLQEPVPKKTFPYSNIASSRIDQLLETSEYAKQIKSELVFLVFITVSAIVILFSYLVKRMFG